MTRTEWRDDYTRIVKGRATAYSKGETGWRMAMPFENVHGNGGLLTTVSDLLRWNAALDAGTLAGRGFAAEQQTAGRAGGRKADPLRDGPHARTRGREPARSATTARPRGYRAGLARYPDLGLSVAVLCNTADASGSVLPRQVAEAFLGDRLAADARRHCSAGPRPPSRRAS